MSFIFFIFLTASHIISAQDPERFRNEIDVLKLKSINLASDKSTILFVGSSSLRLWNGIEMAFSDYNVINFGFGGSHFSDLLYFYDELIASTHADYICIYEGDNDLADLKPIDTLLSQAKLLIKNIKMDNPSVKIMMISPKPSLARWTLKDQYILFNKKLNSLCELEDIIFVDVWNSMIDKNGNLKDDIFLEDGLHLNEKGYEILRSDIQTALN